MQFDEDEKQKLIEETHVSSECTDHTVMRTFPRSRLKLRILLVQALVTVRPKTLTNIVEFREYKIVYRQYAGLVRFYATTFFC